MLMTAYLNWQGLTEAELSLYLGAGAVSGLAAIDIRAPCTTPPVYQLLCAKVCS